MTHRPLGRLSAISLVLLLTVSGVFRSDASAAYAAPLSAQAESLEIVPEDAAFYVAMLRNREQIEAIGNSRAWAQLKSIQSLQMGWMLLSMQLQQPDSPFGQVKQFFEVPENRPLLGMLRDMVSDEIFYYGDNNYANLMELLLQVNRANQAAGLSQAFEGGGQEARARALVEMLADHTDQLQIPATVVGFRLPSTEVAESQLQRLEAIVSNVLAAQAPEHSERFGRKKIGDGEYLVVSLDGSLIPWDEVDLSESGADQESIDKLTAHLKQMTLEIHLGLYKNFLIVSTGPNGNHLKSLGQGKSLAKRAEFKRLAPLADEPLLSITYASEQLATSVASVQNDLETVRNLADTLLPQAELDQDVQERIRSDINDLIDSAETEQGEAGAMLGASYSSDRGVESYTYNWSDNPILDGSKQLSLLKHLGGTPLLAVVGRTNYDPEEYEGVRELVRLAYGYFEEIALPEMSDKEREQFDAAKEKLLPLIKRIDRTTKTLLIPALADSQLGFVIDAKAKSKQWLTELPATAQPLPMLEPAILLGVSDSEQLVKAMKQYRKAINEGIAVMAELSEGEVDADVSIPAPKVQQVEEGTIYAYPLPAEAGLDKRVTPNAGLSDSVAVVSASRQHTRRLLAESSLPGEGLLGETDRPLAAFTYCHMAGFVQAIQPWIELAVRVNTAPGGEGEGLGDPANDNENTRQVLNQVDTVLSVLQCLRSHTSITYQDDDVWVTRGELHVVDLEN
ncbi:MAG: hypothetical protein KDA42_11605 [Planctomycetales bacterium]|nr:hypothetical protein [Planctomycetales bacterium]